MFSKNYYLLAALVLATTMSAAMIPTKARTAESCITGQCHPAMLKAKNVHPAAKSCDDCHQAALTPHPQKGTQTFKLAEKGAALCKMCHTAYGSKKVVHDPVKSGECTSCHNPHDSNEEKLLVQPKEKLCSECHSDKMKMEHMHGPAAVGDCTICHAPHESDNQALLVKKGSDLCFTCHGTIQEEMKKKVVHAALEEGCTSCHNPHGSAFKKLLAADGEKLCYPCHSKVKDRIDKSKTVHAPIRTATGCASCHAPHASDGDKLMQKAGGGICRDCHKNVVKKGQTVLHGPVKENKCTPCHDPHGSPYSKLLVKSFSTDMYLPYTDNEYSLCFSCHNRDLLRYSNTSFATGFRDGEKNLHFVHVNKKVKGRNCKTCHDMHAGTLPKLIQDKVLFTKWDLPLKYVKWETGGSCAPGCHKKFVYDRKTPGKAPEPEKPKESEKPKAPEKSKEPEKPKGK